MNDESRTSLAPENELEFERAVHTVPEASAPVETRRGFVRALAVGAGALGAAVALGRRATGAPQAATGRTLVTAFWRGGFDGLSLVAPTNDLYYQQQRGALKVLPSSQDPRVKTLDANFELGPAAETLFPLYLSGRAAFVHRTGLTNNSQSHFHAMYALETANNPVAVNPNQTDGWLARHMQQFTGSASDLRGMGHSSILPRTLTGAPETLPIPDPQDYDLPSSWGPQDTLALRKLGLQVAYADPGVPALVGQGGVNTINTITTLGGVNFDLSTRPNYGPGPFGDQLWKTAQLIRAKAGNPTLVLDAVMIDYGGWDHHSGLSPNQPDAHGNGFFSKMKVVADSLVAFESELQNHGLGDDYLFLGTSEFGRRIGANGSEGVDHGTGNAWIVMGSGVQGNAVYAGTWPGLQAADVNGSLDLVIDYRNVLGDALVNRFGLPANLLPLVFPGHTYVPQGIVL